MVSFNTDMHALMGDLHRRGGTPCQDYVLASVLEGGGAYAIAADGCSGGGRTDIGARVMSLTTENAVREEWHTKWRRVTADTVPGIRAHRRSSRKAVRAPLGLNNLDLLATSLFAYLSTDGGFIHLVGDGVIAWKLRNGTIRVFRYEWDRGIPCYEVYDEDGYEGFIAEHGGDLDAIRLRGECWEFASGTWTQLDSEEITLGDGIHGITKVLPPALELTCAAVFTDGVALVGDMDWKEVVAELLAFKTTGGQFAVRRLNAFVKTAGGLGKIPQDDLSYAVIHCTQDDEVASGDAMGDDKEGEARC